MRLTMNGIRNTIWSNVAEKLNDLDADSATHDCAEDLIEAIREAAQNADGFEVIYNHEAYELICNAYFNEHHADDYDFSECADAFECIMMQGQQVAASVSLQLIDEIESDLCDNSGIEEFFEFVKDQRLADNKPATFFARFSNNDPYGWAAHQYETDCGICVHNNLEGELRAFSLHIGGGFYLSTHYTK